MNIKNNISEIIGNTPMIWLNRINTGYARIAVKLESSNPGGSIKDRIANAMIDDAIQSGKIDNNYTIIEPTSGNTGIGLAMKCAYLGLKLIIVLPESMSIERRKILQAYGAELVLTPADQGMNGAIAKAKELIKLIPKGFIPYQFINKSNPEAHKRTTALEIWNDTNGEIDIFIAGVGTGGTISGVSETLKEKKSQIQTVAIEPENSPVISGGEPGSHKIQGIGAGFIPENLNLSVIDDLYQINDSLAIKTAAELASKEGIFCGISSGANVYAAIQYSQMKKNKDKLIVTMINDTGERYLSTSLFN